MLRPSSTPPPYLWLLSRSLRSRSTPESGLTLIECLVAIVIVSITVVAITPPIFVATASRIQSRRAEQANAIAQGEIDRIRTIAERGTYTIDELPAIGGTGAATAIAAASGVQNLIMSPGTCTPRYPQATPAASNQVIPVDIDGDCNPEFAMQVFRTNGCIPDDLKTVVPPVPPYSFTVGVRVYGYEVGNPMSNLSTERARLGMTAGRAADNSAAGALRQPLQVLYSKVSRVGNERAIECANKDL
jgi:prepilin-type N-terminal cleavage/methylation domain-containing protein